MYNLSKRVKLKKRKLWREEMKQTMSLLGEILVDCLATIVANYVFATAPIYRVSCTEITRYRGLHGPPETLLNCRQFPVISLALQGDELAVIRPEYPGYWLLSMSTESKFVRTRVSGGWELSLMWNKRVFGFRGKAVYELRSNRYEFHGLLPGDGEFVIRRNEQACVLIRDVREHVKEYHVLHSLNLEDCTTTRIVEWPTDDNRRVCTMFCSSNSIFVISYMGGKRKKSRHDVHEWNNSSGLGIFALPLSSIMKFITNDDDYATFQVGSRLVTYDIRTWSEVKSIERNLTPDLLWASEQSGSRF